MMIFLILLMLAIITAIPVLFVFTTAFTDESVLASEGYRLLPSALSLDGFRAVLKYGKKLFVSYGVTIFVTVTGTVFGACMDMS